MNESIKKLELGQRIKRCKPPTQGEIEATRRAIKTRLFLIPAGIGAIAWISWDAGVDYAGVSGVLMCAISILAAHIVGTVAENHLIETRVASPNFLRED